MWVKENQQTREDFIFLHAPHTEDPLLPQSVWRSVWWAAAPGKTRGVFLGCSRWEGDLPRLPQKWG